MIKYFRRANVFAVIFFVTMCCVSGEHIESRAVADDLEHVLLFDSGSGEYPRYRIPALVATPSGILIAVCEGRKDGRGLTGNIDLVCRRSRDHGKTWSPEAVVADDGNNTLGNPCLVRDDQRKVVWLAFTRSLGSDTEEGIVDGTSRESTRVFVISTSDEGETWTKPVDITATAKSSDWTWYGTGPGVGIQLKSGRLVIPSYHTEAELGIYRSHMVFSDDHGETWTHGAAVGNQCSECHIVETREGDLVLNARTTVGKERRTTSRSHDGGESWLPAEFDERLYDPHCQACVIALPPTKEQPSRWLFTHPAGPDRRDLTARLSFDEGKSWPTSRLLRKGDSQYSCTAVLPDGSIGCLYDCWKDGNYRLFYVRFDLIDFRN